MFSFISKLFKTKNNIKQYSISTDPATVGSDNKLDLNADIKALVNRCYNDNKITNDDMNKIAEYVFNVPNIPPGLYKLNSAFTDSFIFTIDRVSLDRNKLGDLENIDITLIETSHNLESLKLQVSVKDFREVLKLIKFDKSLTEREET